MHADSIAPVAVFAYNRPDHIARTMSALAANTLAQHTEVTVYLDGPKSAEDKYLTDQVREVVRRAQGFKSLKIVESRQNKGLARNIYDGVTECCNRSGRVIVLEDDLVTSPHFLTFMNRALDRYRQEPKVWHVSGWNYPISAQDLGDAFFLRIMNCWGWATWEDRWKHFRKDPADLIANFTRSDIREFDLGNTGVFWNQVLANQKGTRNTWAVFWYATIFRNGGLCLNPAVSYVENIGLDGSGTHSKRTDSVFSNSILSQNSSPAFSGEIVENATAIRRIKAYYESVQQPFLSKLAAKIKLVLGFSKGAVRVE